MLNTTVSKLFIIWLHIINLLFHFRYSSNFIYNKTSVNVELVLRFYILDDIAPIQLLYFYSH